MPWITVSQLADQLHFVLPLLSAHSYVARTQAGIVTTLAGQRFLEQPSSVQLDHLRTAWLDSPHPDRWLVALLPQRGGIDWPLLRRRLWQWGSALPADQWIEPEHLYPRLAAVFGPLANAQTHGFRQVDRVPWQPRRAAMVWDGALRGPLHWLGLIHWSDPAMGGAYVAHAAQPLLPPATAPWQYGTAGTIRVPTEHLDARVLAIVPIATWTTTDVTYTSYQITPARLAQAKASGHTLERIWAVIEAAAGPLPPSWHALRARAVPPLRLRHVPVLIAESPALLDRAVRGRNFRRYLQERPAPGVALVSPEQVPALLRALDREQIPVHQDHALPTTASGSSPLTPGAAAALLVACAFYRRHAPSTASLLPDADLEQWLSAQIAPPLRRATEAALADLLPSVPLPRDGDRMEPVLTRLREALTTGEPILIWYYTASRAAWTERRVQPRSVEHLDAIWYLRAWCCMRQEERTFRVDRIGDITDLPPEVEVRSSDQDALAVVT